MLVTDWAEIKDLHTFHKVAATHEDAVRIVMQRTSVDMSMVPEDTSFTTYLIDLVRQGAACGRSAIGLGRWMPLTTTCRSTL